MKRGRKEPPVVPRDLGSGEGGHARTARSIRAVSTPGWMPRSGSTRKNAAVPGRRLRSLTVRRVANASGVMNPLVPLESPTTSQSRPPVFEVRADAEPVTCREHPVEYELPYSVGGSPGCDRPRSARLPEIVANEHGEDAAPVKAQHRVLLGDRRHPATPSTCSTSLPSPSGNTEDWLRKFRDPACATSTGA